MRKDDIILFRGIHGRPTKGRVRHTYDSGRLGVWRRTDGHYVIIDPIDIITTLPKEDW